MENKIKVSYEQIDKANKEIETIKLERENTRYYILELMKKDNYFKSIEEYEKATKWVEEDIIPSWFKEDMKKYYNKILENKNINLLN